jgi:hypothetical protein
MPILNYTTKIDPAKSVLEIQRALSARVESVSVEYTNGQPAGVLFTLRVAGSVERVAWRIVKDWIEAQMAIVEAGQAEMAEVFLPYATIEDGTTTMFRAFQLVQERKAITDGGLSAKGDK